VETLAVALVLMTGHTCLSQHFNLHSFYFWLCI